MPGPSPEGSGTPAHSTDKEFQKQVDAAKAQLSRGELARAKRKIIKDKINSFMETNGVVLIILFFTIWSLFGSDIWVLADPPKSADDIQLGLSSASFFIFLAEWILAIWCQELYLGSFFFYLDFVATISLLPDVCYTFGVILIDTEQVSFARAGRAARAGTRAVRFVRIFKIFTLMKKKTGTVTAAESMQMKPSKVGSKLMDLITQKVIVIVAVMLILSTVVDQFDQEVEETDQAVLANLEFLYQLSCFDGQFGYECPHDPMGDNSTAPRMFRDAVQRWISLNNDEGLGVIYLAVDGLIIYPHDFFQLYIQGGKELPWAGLREQPAEEERATFTATWPDGTSHVSTLLRSATKKEQLSSLAELLKIIMVISVLALSSWLFARDAQQLVIDPLEKMSNLVERLVNNPLMDIEKLDREREEQSQATKGGHHSTEGEMETEFVETSLKKFVKLLQIAFGEAGAEIIGKNLAAGEELNPMLRGRKVMGTYGFCDIRNFTDCTECLEERVMPFVNGIAKYVHTSTKENDGAPNKNIGDAFLLVWRSKNPDAVLADQIAVPGDLCLRAFVRMVLECSVDVPLHELTEDPKIQARIPGYKTKMGFGLHYGWSVEGAIGSILKIDASYLSPHVNMASRLEGATKGFGVTILLSEGFMQTLSPKVRALCRRIDRGIPKGMDQPIELWTYDLPQPIFGDKLPPVHDDAFWENFPPCTSTSFRREFAAGYDSYIDGHWEVATAVMKQCLAQRRDDGPSAQLLEVMQEYDFVAPPTWKGYRYKIDM